MPTPTPEPSTTAPFHGMHFQVNVSEEEKGVRRVCVEGWAPENHQGGEVSGPADYIEVAVVHYLQFWFFGIGDWDRRTEKTILKLKKEIARRFSVNEELKRRYKTALQRGRLMAFTEQREFAL